MQQLRNDEHDPVLCYKAQGTEHPSLNKEDFVLGLQTLWQIFTHAISDLTRDDTGSQTASDETNVATTSQHMEPKTKKGVLLRKRY